MAWIDDRIWCHPKFADISDRAFRVWVSGVAYSTGFATRGALTPGMQKQVGSDARVRRELVAAGVWDEMGSGSVLIHDWDEHNSKRDARRANDRDRKRKARAESSGTSAGQSAGSTAVAARVDGSEGSEGRSRAVRGRAEQTVAECEQPGIAELEAHTLRRMPA